MKIRGLAVRHFAPVSRALAQAIDEYGPGVDLFALKASRAIARQYPKPRALFDLLALIADAAHEP